MDVQFTGTGGRAGWPEPGCGCASCARAGPARAPAEIVLDGVVRITFPVRGAAAPARPPGYLAGRVPGGLEITAPDGSRLLCADGPGAVPQPPDGAAPYDAVLLDLLGDPAQLGGMRRRGAVTGATVVAVLHADHRVTSGRELARRCGLWHAVAPADGDHIEVRPRAGPARAASRAAAATTDPGAPAPAPGGTAPAAPASAAARPWRTLVLGGARSGKSAEAELRLAGEPEVTYVATAGPPRGGDAEWAARVAAHRARRPHWWQTVELTAATDLAGVLRAATGGVLVDSIGGWLAAVLEEAGAWRRPAGGRPVASHLAARIGDLAGAWRDTRGHVVAVSEEAGSGVVPATESGRCFRDELGILNQLLAAQAEEAVLVVAGRVLSLPG
jgi:adenosylcobinamide kinase / adenosylcobinamide-phosphate guanylyltransferase